MKNFGLVGVAGFVAARHLNAIKETNNSLLAALDKFDSVGIMDSYFPQADFFVEFERFDRHLETLKYEQNLELDYVSVCTPNYLHDAHVRFALRRGADAICEKPLVLNPWNIDKLAHIEKESGKRIWNILQSRLHPSILSLREKVRNNPKNTNYDVDLTYITSRGSWYFSSWKGDISKSGGVATNIGVHFFDMLTWIFGAVRQNTVHLHEADKAAGLLELENARIRWFLSLDYEDLPDKIKGIGQRTYRSIIIEDEELEFSGGFTDLHTKSYEQILDGKGFGIEDTRQSIEIVHDIREKKTVALTGDYHPMIKNIN
ncbi:UDP-N-acetyl-2-amino-2-deoxyglucuronate dehydrogenase [Pricia antarctica]|uniref:UDP-N-acetyl-2-amino-2-deoxyglucuronate dehydrogenase n=1 Tax=Pricia antarctica TaxID=641691 RepID=A0A1G6YRD1_9FLAO|nr:Gfo/Idh/MocA family oxidoreductase [Pricia antarctica]SDD92215.1 UDP-N-acetyl-2-amino-2-deoxyglucuronate dehydrogenase [Pricia antarctica]